MKDIFWKYFTETGNIELYLEYKKHSRRQESSKNERSDKDKGADRTHSQQRG